MFHLWMMTRARCKANPSAPSTPATMPPSTPWSTTKAQTQGNHEVMKLQSSLQRREQRPQAVSLGKGCRRIALDEIAKLRKCDRMLCTSLVNLQPIPLCSFRISGSPGFGSQAINPESFLSHWGSDQCSATATQSPHLRLASLGLVKFKSRKVRFMHNSWCFPYNHQCRWKNFKKKRLPSNSPKHLWHLSHNFLRNTSHLTFTPPWPPCLQMSRNLSPKQRKRQTSH